MEFKYYITKDNDVQLVPVNMRMAPKISIIRLLVTGGFFLLMMLLCLAFVLSALISDDRYLVHHDPFDVNSRIDGQ